MGDEDDGPAGLQALYGVDHGGLAFDVEVRGRLVQQEERGVAEEGAGQGEALALAR